MPWQAPGTVTQSHNNRNGSGMLQTAYSVEEAARLQGLPDGYLSDAPFTRAGKLQAIANGVPLPMGRAIARAVRAYREGCLS